MSPSSSAASAPTPSTARSPSCSATTLPRASPSTSSTASASCPFYEENLDATATPAAAVTLRERVAGADAVLAITPEYNGTMPAVLNNAIDWLSRPYGVGAIVGKPFGVLGTTPTPYGGKWAHEDAVRSAGIAGAIAVDGGVVSQSALEVDSLTDTDVLERFLAVVNALVAFEAVAA